jgi:hypothetical protein
VEFREIRDVLALYSHAPLDVVFRRAGVGPQAKLLVAAVSVVTEFVGKVSLAVYCPNRTSHVRIVAGLVRTMTSDPSGFSNAQW